MRQIGQGVPELWSLKQTHKQRLLLYIYKYRFFLIFGFKPKQPHARLLLIFQNKYLSLIFSLLLFAGGWILARELNFLWPVSPIHIFPVRPYYRNQTALLNEVLRLQSMYNHMVGRTASFVSPFYSLLPGCVTKGFAICNCLQIDIFL